MIIGKSLIFTVCFWSLLVEGSIASAQALEDCPKDENVSWTNCHGSRSYPDGSIYIGDFQAGRRSGRGMLYSNGEVNYLGEFVNDQFEGSGVLWMPGGMKFAGEFRQGRISGLGVMNATDADKHIGEFKDGILTRPATFAQQEKSARPQLPPPSTEAQAPVDTHMRKLDSDLISLAFLFCFTGFLVDVTLWPRLCDAAGGASVRRHEWLVLLLAIFLGGVFLRPTIGQLAAPVAKSLIQLSIKESPTVQTSNRSNRRMMPRM